MRPLTQVRVLVVPFILEDLNHPCVHLATPAMLRRPFPFRLMF
jgi:hypothetical protein